MSTEIDQLDIASGLKELLISKDFTKADEIMKMDSDDLARALGIDTEVAKLLRNSAKND